MTVIAQDSLPPLADNGDSVKLAPEQGHSPGRQLWPLDTLPTAPTQLAALPWREVPVAYAKAERGHGRAERRTLKVTAVAQRLGLPLRRPGHPDHPPPQTEGEVVARDLLRGHLADPTQATYIQLAAIIRGHWRIEDRLHWVRDMDYDEDRSQIRTASGPRIMASLRYLAITILSLAGAASIAAALRYHARRPAQPLQTITNC